MKISIQEFANIIKNTDQNKTTTYSMFKDIQETFSKVDGDKTSINFWMEQAERQSKTLNFLNAFVGKKSLTANREIAKTLLKNDTFFTFDESKESEDLDKVLNFLFKQKEFYNFYIDGFKDFSFDTLDKNQITFDLIEGLYYKHVIDFDEKRISLNVIDKILNDFLEDDKLKIPSISLLKKITSYATKDLLIKYFNEIKNNENNLSSSYIEKEDKKIFILLKGILKQTFFGIHDNVILGESIRNNESITIEDDIINEFLSLSDKCKKHIYKKNPVFLNLVNETNIPMIFDIIDNYQGNYLSKTILSKDNYMSGLCAINFFENITKEHWSKFDNKDKYLLISHEHFRINHKIPSTKKFKESFFNNLETDPKFALRFISLFDKEQLDINNIIKLFNISENTPRNYSDTIFKNLMFYSPKVPKGKEYEFKVALFSTILDYINNPQNNLDILKKVFITHPHTLNVFLSKIIFIDHYISKCNNLKNDEHINKETFSFENKNIYFFPDNINIQSYNEKFIHTQLFKRIRDVLDFILDENLFLKNSYLYSFDLKLDNVFDKFYLYSKFINKIEKFKIPLINEKITQKNYDLEYGGYFGSRTSSPKMELLEVFPDNSLLKSANETSIKQLAKKTNSLSTYLSMLMHNTLFDKGYDEWLDTLKLIHREKELSLELKISNEVKGTDKLIRKKI